VSLTVLVLRHGLAGQHGDLKKIGRPDSERPLTEQGVKEVKKVVHDVGRIVDSIDVVLSSSFTRARETADILAEEFQVTRVLELRELKPHVAPSRLMRALQKMGRSRTVAVVGHEPHLSRFISFALTGSSRPFFDIKKAGFAILEFQSRVDKKQAQVKCFIQPAQLKKIRKK
jgi:phosphohistidine phosphatase